MSDQRVTLGFKVKKLLNLIEKIKKEVIIDDDDRISSELRYLIGNKSDSLSFGVTLAKFHTELVELQSQLSVNISSKLLSKNNKKRSLIKEGTIASDEWESYSISVGNIINDLILYIQSIVSY
jgi:hypothetical protein